MVGITFLLLLFSIELFFYKSPFWLHFFMYLCFYSQRTEFMGALLNSLIFHLDHYSSLLDFIGFWVFFHLSVLFFLFGVLVMLGVKSRATHKLRKWTLYTEHPSPHSACLLMVFTNPTSFAYLISIINGFILMLTDLSEPCLTVGRLLLYLSLLLWVDLFTSVCHVAWANYSSCWSQSYGRYFRCHHEIWLIKYTHLVALLD